MDELVKKLYFRLYDDYCYGKGCGRSCQFYVHDICTFPFFSEHNKQRILNVYEHLYGNKLPSFTPEELRRRDMEE